MYTVNREIFVFKNLRVINFRVKKSSSASGSDEDFLTTKFFKLRNFVYTRLTRACRMEELRRESCIRGHHVYKSRWNPVLGEVLLCEREPHNATDRYSIAGSTTLLCITFLADYLLHFLFAKAMACDGRMDDSDPSNSSGTKNRHLNYTEIFVP